MDQKQPRVGRRLAAILAADVSGYSRLMHDDKEATHSRLKALMADAIEPLVPDRSDLDRPELAAACLEAISIASSKSSHSMMS
jgi:hypothetical protein